LVSVRSGGVLSVAMNFFHADACRAFKHCTYLKLVFAFRD